MKPQFLQKLNIHADWNSFISYENQKHIKEIENKMIEGEFTPAPEKVLRFLEFPLHSAKIIILGQDPYPQAGVATGRAFEVGTLKSWNQPFRNVSLKNILRAVYKAYTGKVLKFNYLKEKMDNEFPVLPPGGFFANWEKQGVLLLNTSFTCQTGKPGSHQKYWEDFTQNLLEFISINAENATWFLWGNHAFKATRYLSLKNYIFTNHPMMCNSNGRENDFLFGRVNCFEPFIPDIDWTGYGLKKGLKTNNKLF